MLIQKPKGTYDLLPEKARQRYFLETKVRENFEIYNFSEIRTPTFEKTELFKRGIGEETDIVSKEMYTFKNDEFTLKPEMTAPVIRAYIENNLNNESPLQKLFYITNMFRRERPQAGRFREFSQFGAESIGSNDPYCDAEMIILADSIIRSFGIDDSIIKLNTIGTAAERDVFFVEFKNYLSNYLNELSPDSQRRFVINPLRILDTKNPGDLKILKDAPVLYNFLNDETKGNFEKILDILTVNGIEFETDNRLVRGFDYYTSTTFEFISDALGAQNALLGGGRYDLLIQQLGGKPTPAIGFAAGIERLLMIMESKELLPDNNDELKLFIVSMGEESKKFSFKMLENLRNIGVKCETDFLNRSVKSQMKEANRSKAEFVIVIGDEEIKSNSVKLKKMSDGSEVTVSGFENIKFFLDK
ncbi:MAG TPA: histidine--tRNA ligase [Ignavibacteria bacterium]|nr:histidine--tRNA ligase [Ignavibacteria bacterium]HQY53409.1 histidine--tRNA ligase [Ignavibacteria bacterium]HRB00614.1 histidine--tRNA ligase [Ignavibacteria bacterium]